MARFSPRLRGVRELTSPTGDRGLAIAVAVLALFVYAGINFFVTRLAGQPVNADGSYYFNIHGSRIPISREQYGEALRLQVRLFTGHMLVFTGAGTALLLATLRAPATAAVARSAIAIDWGQRRMDLSPRVRVLLGSVWYPRWCSRFGSYPVRSREAGQRSG